MDYLKETLFFFILLSQGGRLDSSRFFTTFPLHYYLLPLELFEPCIVVINKRTNNYYLSDRKFLSALPTPSYI